MKKKLIALGLAAAMVIVAAVGGTLAYLTDTAEATNVFTVGDVEIELRETASVTLNVKNATEPEQQPEKFDVASNGVVFSNIVPGNNISKNVILTNKNAATPAYVRMAVIINNIEEINSALEKYNSATIIDGTWIFEESGFASVEGVTCEGIDVYYDGINNYSSTLLPETQASSIINGNEIIMVYYLKLDGGAALDMTLGLHALPEFTRDDLAMFDGLTINIYTDAIQAEGFANAADAFVQLEATHSIAADRVVIPDAKVTVLNESIQTEKFGNASAFFVNKDTLADDIPLALNFKPYLGDINFGHSKDYMSWNADFEISFDTVIPNDKNLGDYITADAVALVRNFNSAFDPEEYNDKITLIGQYDGFGSIAVPVPMKGEIAANEGRKVMSQVFGDLFGAWGEIKFSEVCSLCGEPGFNCGIVLTDGYNITEEVNVTIDLVIYEPVDGGEPIRHVVCSETYTIPAANTFVASN